MNLDREIGRLIAGFPYGFPEAPVKPHPLLSESQWAGDSRGLGAVLQCVLLDAYDGILPNGRTPEQFLRDLKEITDQLRNDWPVEERKAAVKRQEAAHAAMIAKMAEEAEAEKAKEAAEKAAKKAAAEEKRRIRKARAEVVALVKKIHPDKVASWSRADLTMPSKETLSKYWVYYLGSEDPLTYSGVHGNSGESWSYDTGMNVASGSWYLRDDWEAMNADELEDVVAWLYQRMYRIAKARQKAAALRKQRELREAGLRAEEARRAAANAAEEKRLRDIADIRRHWRTINTASWRSRAARNGGRCGYHPEAIALLDRIEAAQRKADELRRQREAREAEIREQEETRRKAEEKQKFLSAGTWDALDNIKL